MPIELNIDGIIGEAPNRASDVRAALRAGGPVTLSINSPGGYALEGLAIFNLLKAYAGRVTVIVDSIAASAASLIAMAGDRITMRDGAMLMIHDPAALTIGNADAHEKSRDVLDKMGDQFAKIYAQRSGLSDKKVRALMRKETWMNATEATDLGFAEAASSKAVAASIAAFGPILEKFRNTPATLMALAKAQQGSSKMSKKPKEKIDDVIVDDVVVDVTSDILNLAAIAKLSAADAVKIVAAAGGSIDKAKDLIIEAKVKADPQPTIVMGDPAGGDPDGHAVALGGAIAARLTGQAPTGDATRFAGVSAIGLMSERLRALGITASASPNAIFEATFGNGGGRFARMSSPGFHGTSDFPLILANELNKRLMNLFQAAQSGAARIAATGQANDFRPHQIGKLSSFPSLEKVLESGEITYGSLVESAEYIQIASYARAIAVSFQTLVNDDLGGIDRSIRDIAFATANLKSKLIVAAFSQVLADGNPLFHVSHNNIVDAGDSPSIASVGTMRQTLRDQTALDGETKLGLTPRFLLVPTALETVADSVAGVIEANEVDHFNPFSGKLEVAVEPRFTNQDEWFVFADPAMSPVVEFKALSGFETPRLEVSEQWDRLGTAYRVHWHVGAGVVDHRGAVKNEGNVTS